MAANKEHSATTQDGKNSVKISVRYQKELQIKRMQEVITQAGGSIEGPVLVARLEVTSPYLSHEKALELVTAGIQAGIIITNVNEEGKEVLLNADSVRA